MHVKRQFDVDRFFRRIKGGEMSRREATASFAAAGLGTVSLPMGNSAQADDGTGADITHIPYKGGGQQITDALSGQFEVLSVNASPAIMGHIKAGKLHPLAAGSPQRLEALPDVPTLAELGLPAANLASVFGLFAPAGTPEAVVDRMNREVNRLLQQPELRRQIASADNLPTGGSAADFARMIARESAADARIIKAAGITSDK